MNILFNKINQHKWYLNLNSVYILKPEQKIVPINLNLNNLYQIENYQEKFFKVFMIPKEYFN